MKNLNVSFKNIENNLPLSVTVGGKLTAASAMYFKNDLVELIASSQKDCHLDISELKQLDVTGVNALAIAHKTAMRNGNKFIIRSTTANPAEEFLHLSKFNKYFTFQRA